MLTPKSTAEILQKLKIDALNEMQVAAQKAIEKHNEVVLLSPTGTGKTLAFLLPLINGLDPKVDGVQALIIVPGRELALQIEQVVREMGTGYKVNAMYGGQSSAKDKAELVHPPAILIGTPGRLASHFDREKINVDTIKTLVLDEFDKSLEIGFDEDMILILEALTALEKKVLTSATFAVEIPDFIELKDPTKVNFLSDKETALDLQLVLAENDSKAATLIKALYTIGNKNGIIFCNYREDIELVSELLKQEGMEHGCFHGGMEQRDREESLIQFRNGTYQLLVATDLAARGIDIPDLDFILHYQLPHHEEEFIHRNGRTARMKKEGTAFVLANAGKSLPDFIKTTKQLKLTAGGGWKQTEWETLFITGGRKDKISKGDIAGLFFKEVGLGKTELGLIELKQNCAYVAVHKTKAAIAMNKANNTRLKKKKVRVRNINS